MHKITVFSVLSLSLLALGCGSKEKVYKIAIAVPLTGDIAAMGQGMKRGAELAVEEANASGRFQRKIELRPFDDRADPKEAVNVANQIVSDPSIAAIVGHLNSGCSIPAAQVYAKNNLLMITPAATNPKLTLQQLEPSWKWVKNVFRVNTTDDVQGQFAANYCLQSLKIQSVAIIHDKTPYGQGLAEEFQKEFETKGGGVLSFDGIAIGDKDFKALLTRIKSLNPQTIYFGGIYNEGGLIVKQARELGLKATFVSGDALQTSEYFKVAGSAAEGSYITNVGVPPQKIPEAKSFLEKYSARFPQPDLQPYDHYTYEAAKIALDVLEKAGIQGDSIDKLRMIETMKNLKFNGVLGTTEFDEKGDTKNKAITVYLVKGNNFVPLN
ncbi:MAG: branched-chain amino acid ABC transporter substrate-binding protein [Elusimicrobia bacterium]|nr:branched-chain amino acid ABC transporter substrate-binding protein [Elusimicrobiota bacterium]